MMIRKIKSGQYGIYSRKIDSKTHKRKNPGTFDLTEAANRYQVTAMKDGKEVKLFLEA